MSLTCSLFAYSLLSHKTFKGKEITKNSSLWNPDNVAFPTIKKATTSYLCDIVLCPWQALVIRISRIDVVVLSIGNSSVVYYQECAKWDKKLPIENWKWCWWPSAESGFVGFRFQADRKRWEQIGFGSRLGCRRSCRRKLGGFHTSPDFIFFPAKQRQKTQDI